jgi:hypothetical protein
VLGSGLDWETNGFIKKDDFRHLQALEPPNSGGNRPIC